ncbi:sugar transferase [Parahaliea mediterranea]|uniref:Sugar transferase n=2 Tax=Parahaliea mediterranea TaxID=651086 RepID=A0A939IKX0_9GAMM|nr:sugar transferase [Parahaliea mediterranea]
MQRLLDILLAGTAIVVLSPVLIPVVIALRFTGEGEIFYLQKRIGYGGRAFGVFKFATMLKDSPNMNTGTITVRGDPRVLPLGRFLRKTKINELPQLANILIGDMSLVGPRPQTERCFEAFPERSKMEVVKVRPGLSGIGSIVFRGEEDMIHESNDPECFYDQVIMPYKGLLEEWYVANRSLENYLKCIFVTVWVVIFPRSSLVWSAFKGLPRPPSELVRFVNYPG